LVAIVSLLFANSSGAQVATNDERTIQSIITGFSDIWAKADVDAFEGLLTEDAEWVVRSGTLLDGRPAVVAHHANLMRNNFSGSKVVWQTLGIRFLRPDVAIAHVATVLTLRDGAQRPGTVTLVFAKEADRWLLTAVQNTDHPAQ
jgi:uncharacterized protein (TIGR02246 family)